MKEGQSSKKAVLRVGIILIGLLIAFAVIRQLSVPKSFGQYGYYRGDSVKEWVNLETNYASGNDACGTCHQAVVQGFEQAEHKRLDCQVCHGPLEEHVEKPGKVSLGSLGVIELCGTCHKELTGRSEQQIPTVKLIRHSGGVECTLCHEPHQPWAKMGRMKQ